MRPQTHNNSPTIGRLAVSTVLACLAASCATAPAPNRTIPALALASTTAPVPSATIAPSRPTMPIAQQGASAEKTTALRVRAGLYDISVGDASDIGLGVHLTGDFRGESSWGGGADLFVATTFGDAGELDDRATAVRLWGYVLYAHPTSPLLFKFGPEVVSASAGDEVGGEYDGFGFKASAYGETPVGETLTGFGEIGLGFNSGDGELYSSGAKFDEEFTILDLVFGLKSEDGIAGGLELQFFGADEGEDLEVIGLFARFDF